MRVIALILLLAWAHACAVQHAHTAATAPKPPINWGHLTIERNTQMWEDCGQPDPGTVTGEKQWIAPWYRGADGDPDDDQFRDPGVI